MGFGAAKPRTRLNSKPSTSPGAARLASSIYTLLRAEAAQRIVATQRGRAAASDSLNAAIAVIRATFTVLG